MASPSPIRSFFSRPGEGDSSTDSESEAAEEDMKEGMPSEHAAGISSSDEDGLTQAELNAFFSTTTASSLSNSIRNATRSSISNRLHSIYADSLFVQFAADAYSLPLVANERCGSWYVPSCRKAGSCYFKSTDGHFGCWSFSKKRLNLNLLDIIGECGGCIIVDSTRRGKSMPDALSKTVPIWCAVLNALLFGESEPKLFVPPSAVSESEASQIERKLGEFVDGFKKLEIEHEKLRKIRKPLRPIWITPHSTLPDWAPGFPGYHPVVLLTASNRDVNRQGEVFQASAYNGMGYNYIQGAGDDPESWAQGLTAVQFWANKDELLSAKETELPSVIGQLARSPNRQNFGAENDKNSPGPDWTVLTRTTKGLVAISDIASAIYLLQRQDKFLGVIDCTCESVSFGIEENDNSNNNEYNESVRMIRGVPILGFPLLPGKRGNKALRQNLGKAMSFAQKVLTYEKGSLLIACESGTDHSVGVALAIIVSFFNDDGELLFSRSGDPPSIAELCPPPTLDLEDLKLDHEINKPLLTKRLGWIVSERPQANPSRSTLLSINSWLMRPS